MSSSVVQNSAPSTPPTSRINPRLLVLILIIAAPLCWMVYTFAKLSITGGIEQVGQYKQVDLKSMGNFVFDDREGTEKNVPPQYRALDGQKVLLVGMMYADMSADDMVDQFQLVYSIQACCFGGPPKVQERVFAHASQGKRVSLYGGLAKVYGTLHVRAVNQNGRVVSLYDMDVEKVEGNG